MAKDGSQRKMKSLDIVGTFTKIEGYRVNLRELVQMDRFKEGEVSPEMRNLA